MTLESLFSPPTKDPTNKTQVVQLPWQGLLPMEASLQPRRCSIFILSLASIVLKTEIKLFLNVCKIRKKLKTNKSKTCSYKPKIFLYPFCPCTITNRICIFIGSVSYTIGLF